MKLSETARRAINNPDSRRAISGALKVTEQTVIRCISVNHENLTKAAALQTIKQETGLSDEQILVSENATA